MNSTCRGMVRSLWIGVLWALPSGSGVALALLQGSAGPLIGVAISASLLPPAVNCVSKSLLNNCHSLWNRETITGTKFYLKSEKDLCDAKKTSEISCDTNKYHGLITQKE